MVKITYDLKKYQCHGQGQTHYHIWGLKVKLICLLFVSSQSDHFWLGYSKCHIWPWKFKVKVMVKVKSDGHIWGLEFNWCVCFSFCGNRTIFGRDIANSAFDHENSRSRSWPRSNPMVTFEVLRSIDMFAFHFRAITHFWLRYSQFDIWPWKFKVKVMAKVKPDGHIWSLEFTLCVCFSFLGNSTIFDWDIANSIFDLENSKSRSRQKSTKI